MIFHKPFYVCFELLKIRSLNLLIKLVINLGYISIDGTSKRKMKNVKSSKNMTKSTIKKWYFINEGIHIELQLFNKLQHWFS